MAYIAGNRPLPGSTVKIHPALYGHWSRGIVMSSSAAMVRVVPFSVDGVIALNGEGLPDLIDLPVDTVRPILGPPTPPIPTYSEDAGHGVDSLTGAEGAT